MWRWQGRSYVRASAAAPVSRISPPVLRHIPEMDEGKVASYEEVARGQIVGDVSGLLKLLFDPESLRLLGVHAIGESATEIIHIGQAVLALGGTVEYFRDAVFNYPALAEAYKVAALNGLNKL